MSEHVITVRHLSKRYVLGKRPSPKQTRRFQDRLRQLAQWKWRSNGERQKRKDEAAVWALKELNFSVGYGERVGIIGRNGAGKSTLLKILSRVVYPSTGEARIRGRLTSLLEVGTGFNDNLSGRENVYLNASLHGLGRAAIAARFDEIVAFSEIGRFIDTPVKHYSSGMRMRLAFAVAANLDADILLMDEVLAVGDLAFQKKCLERLDGMTSHGQTLLLVSHSMDAISRYCDRCIWIDAGTIHMDGDVQDVTAAYVKAVLKVTSTISLASAGVELVESDPATLEAASEATPVGDSAILNEGPTAFLVSAQMIGESAKAQAVFRTDQKLGIEFAYRIAAPGVYVPFIHLICPQGTLAFAAVPPSDDLDSHRLGNGLYRSRCWIPAHLLNIGTYSVSLGIVSPDLTPLKRHIMAEQLLSFHMIECDHSAESARGLMPRKFPGVIRPRLDWSMTRMVATPERGTEVA